MHTIRNFVACAVLLLASQLMLDNRVDAQGAGGSGCSCGPGGCFANYVGCWEACPTGGGFGVDCASLCQSTGCGVATGGGGPSCIQGGGCGQPPAPAFNVHVSNNCQCCKGNGNSCGADTQCCSGYCGSGVCSDVPHCSENGVGCSTGAECCSGYCGADNFCKTPPESPILINLRNDLANYHLTSPSQGVTFDIDGDSVSEQVAWTHQGSDVAFLALDRNRNGLIDDGSELFGNSTRKSDGSVAVNGFDALLDLDGGPSQSDGKLSASDAIFVDLRLWVDRNHNGVTDQGELLSLAGEQFTAIFVASVDSPRRDRNGNEYRLVGTAFVLDRNGEPRPRTVFDVYLSRD